MNYVLALHIIGVIVWMGGLLMLSRLLGYHCDLESAAARDALKRFEHRTYFWAIVPSGLLSLGTGLTMLFFKGGGAGHYLSVDGAWGATFHLKLGLVVLLFVFDHIVMRRMKKLHRDDEGERKPFVIMHGMIGLAFIVIVFAVKTNLLG